jgi:hypothetical protein
MTRTEEPVGFGSTSMLRISLSHPLPPRIRVLTPRELQSVFGGCLGEGSQCSETKDCCASPYPEVYIIQCGVFTGVCDRHH